VRTAKRYFALFQIGDDTPDKHRDSTIIRCEMISGCEPTRNRSEDGIWRGARDAEIGSADEEEPIDSEIEEDFDDLGVF
jgi:hypothetical protein